jgi:predicted amidophosphoribosyltransferase
MTLRTKWRCCRCLRQTPYVVRHVRSPWCQRCKAALDAKGTLVCRDCEAELPRAAFYEGKKLGGRCPVCRRAKDRAKKQRHYALHRAQACARVRAWYQRNRSHAIATSQARYRRKKSRIWRGEPTP